MDASMVLGFWALALLLSATPGPDWALVLGHSLRRRSIVPPLIGVALGYLGLTTVVAAGLGTVVASQPAVLTIVTILGALVLVWIGVGMLRSSLSASSGDTDGAAALDRAPGEPTTDGGAVGTLRRTRVLTKARPDTARIIAQGATVSGLNPKGLLLFIALLPQFVSSSAPMPVWAQMFTLGLVFIASALSVYTFIGVCARRLLAGSARASRILTGIAGAAMVLVATVMMAEHFLA